MICPSPRRQRRAAATRAAKMSIQGVQLVDGKAAAGY